MKPRQLPWKWLLLGLIAFVLLGIALLPRKIGSSSQLRDRVTAALAAWTGGEVRLTGPLQVYFFPSVAIKGRLELVDATRLPLVESVTVRVAKITLNLPDLLLGRIHFDTLRLGNADITLRPPPPPLKPADHAPQEQIANLLAGSPVNVLRFRDSKIHFGTGSEAITNFDAHFDASSGRGTMSSYGSFDFRNESVHFAIDSGEPSQTVDGASMPVAVTFTSTPLVAKLTGTAKLGDEIAFSGDMHAEIANGRRLLRWAGIVLPEGQSLQNISATGGVNWDGTTLTFDDGSFSIDGNAADGLLAITTGAPPRIGGRSPSTGWCSILISPGRGPTTSPLLQGCSIGRCSNISMPICASQRQRSRLRPSSSGVAASPSAPITGWWRAKWASSSCATGRHRAMSVSTCRKLRSRLAWSRASPT